MDSPPPPPSLAGPRVSAAVLSHLSYEAHTLGADQFVEFILTGERNET